MSSTAISDEARRAAELAWGAAMETSLRGPVLTPERILDAVLAAALPHIREQLKGEIRAGAVLGSWFRECVTERARLTAENKQLRSDNAELLRQLDSTIKANIASRRSLCEQNRALKARVSELDLQSDE